MKKLTHIYRNIGAICLVFLMGITLVPKNFYHDCSVLNIVEHHETDEEESHNHSENNCAICDFAFVTSYLVPDCAVSLFYAENFNASNTHYLTKDFWNISTLFLNKSPPSFVIL